MSGHSKWSQIRRQKGVNDAKRGQLFTKLGREITVAARSGTPDPDANFRLRLAVQKARESNMPADNIQRAIQRAAGIGEGASLDEIVYEGYGPGGVAVLVEALTDNRNRTAAAIRAAFSKHGGALGETNAVSFLFNRVGVIRYPASAASADAMLEAAIEAGAEDVESDAEAHEVTCAPEDLFAVRDALVARFGEPESARLDWRPTTTVTLDEDRAASVLRLIEALDDNEDVQNVYANFDIPEAVMQRVSA